MTTEEDWCVKEYAADIHKHLRQKEAARFLFKGQSPQLHMRKWLVQWMDAVCDKMEFHTTVQHLAVYLLDIFMDNHTIHCDHLQIVTLGCLIVAVKLEEKDCLIPRNSDLNQLVRSKYKLIEFVQMEVSILTFFKWDIMYPTAAHFIEYYTLHAVCPSDSCDNNQLSSFELVQLYVQKYVDYFLEITIQNIIFLKFNPSLVAAACIASTRACLMLSPPWPLYLQHVTEYKYVQLRPCMELLLRTLDQDILRNKKELLYGAESHLSKIDRKCECLNLIRT